MMESQRFSLTCETMTELVRLLYLLSVKQPFCILVFGLDQELATKWPYNWFESDPGANFGQKPSKNNQTIKWPFSPAA
jgi:hypothetical protein